MRTFRDYSRDTCFQIRNTILQLRARPTKIWIAVAERSGDTAFRTVGCAQKRRGASLPTAVQNPWLRREPCLVYPCASVVELNRLEAGNERKF
jgi:hypothetical protein